MNATHARKQASTHARTSYASSAAFAGGGPRGGNSFSSPPARLGQACLLGLASRVRTVDVNKREPHTRTCRTYTYTYTCTQNIDTRAHLRQAQLSRPLSAAAAWRKPWVWTARFPPNPSCWSRRAWLASRARPSPAPPPRAHRLPSRGNQSSSFSIAKRSIAQSIRVSANREPCEAGPMVWRTNGTEETANRNRNRNTKTWCRVFL